MKLTRLAMVFSHRTTDLARFAAVLVALGIAAPAHAQTDGVQGKAAASSAPRKGSPYHAASMSTHAKNFNQSVWGVDRLKVTQTASGTLIRFSYHVVDPMRAKALGDKSAKPFLVGHRSKAVLQIPVMDKVGALRQSGVPVDGQEYWMVFSNKGNVVKPGERVSVVIGSFHADGLLVE